MKVYYSSTIFRFGKYKGQPLVVVGVKDHKYLEWCLFNVENFTFSDDSISHIKLLNPLFVLSTEANDLRLSRLNKINKSSKEDTVQEDEYGIDFDEPRPSSGKNYNGWRQEDIDDAFEGDPSFTWNVD